MRCVLALRLCSRAQAGHLRECPQLCLLFCVHISTCQDWQHRKDVLPTDMDQARPKYFQTVPCSCIGGLLHQRGNNVIFFSAGSLIAQVMDTNVGTSSPPVFQRWRAVDVDGVTVELTTGPLVLSGQHPGPSADGVALDWTMSWVYVVFWCFSSFISVLNPSILKNSSKFVPHGNGMLCVSSLPPLLRRECAGFSFW